MSVPFSGYKYVNKVNRSYITKYFSFFKGGGVGVSPTKEGGSRGVSPLDVLL